VTEWIRWFRDMTRDDVGLVGGKNASLGEMLRDLTAAGVAVPDGFAITAEAYREFMTRNELQQVVEDVLGDAEVLDVEDLEARSVTIRQLMLACPLPEELVSALHEAYDRLTQEAEQEVRDEAGEAGLPVAVRSSATAEDLPTASFAGQQESFLYVQGRRELEVAVRRCFASLFTPRAINYRMDMGFDHFSVALSVGVQRMVRSDRASAGVIFTLDPDSGSDSVIYLTSSLGLGENVVQGRVGPDQFWVHKETLRAGHRSLVRRVVGPKELVLIYDRASHRLNNVPTPPERRSQLSLSADEALQLARWALAIEDHYTKVRGQPTPMDIEWAKDGVTGQLFVVQARPETVHSQKTGPELAIYTLKEQGPVLAHGLAIGSMAASGRAHVIDDPRHMDLLQPGEVLVTRSTDPDWEPILRRAAAVITEHGGRTSHAAIVARELGIPAVVAAEGACRSIISGHEVTVACCEGESGRIYEGRLAFDVERVDTSQVGGTRTRIMMNLADPEQALSLARIPCDGVGLARMEFVFANWVRVHPLALTRFDRLSIAEQREVDELIGERPGASSRTEYLVDTLAQGIGLLAAAFHPRPVILRFSDFKTNEYAHLLGGEAWEPAEPNPMIGWRGASRYCHPGYREGFLLECQAIRRVREDMGLTNLKVMVPFCRTPEEGQRVLETMAQAGLERGKDGLEVYVMAEIPSNILLADEFAALFDGFSIGTNDLTQLILGVDRDSDRVAPLFDDRNPAVKKAISQLLAAARAANKPVGICGQAPSDYPEFAAFLVAEGIDSISLTPDAVVRTSQVVARAEQEEKGEQ
jgi:pyruvate, water dikinase